MQALREVSSHAFDYADAEALWLHDGRHQVSTQKIDYGIYEKFPVDKKYHVDLGLLSN